MLRESETKKARYNYGPALFFTTRGVRVASDTDCECVARATAPTAISSLNKHDIIKRTAARQTLAN